MFKHILVPLDGSRLAEAAIPVAATLAGKLGATVTLIHVIEHNAPQEIHGEHHLGKPEEALDYLKRIARESFPKQTVVDTHVHTDEVASVSKSIVDHAGEFAPDLIVMCAHGSGGLRDILVGSIAQQVIGTGKTPVLLIQPQPGDNAPFDLRQVLAPLDGDPEHEHGLQVAAEMAAAFTAELTLLVVVPTLGTLSLERAATGRLLPGTMKALLNMSEQDSSEYLEKKIRSLTVPSLVCNATVRRGEPGLEIANYARSIHADLIVLGTHGKAGTEAFWSGSVAPKLPGLTNIPLLFVPVSQPSPTPGSGNQAAGTP